MGLLTLQNWRPAIPVGWLQIFSCSPDRSGIIPAIGNGHGFAGLEILLMSFAGCVSTTIVFLLGRSGKHISSYSASAEGIRSEHPLSLKEIRFHIRIESEEIMGTDMENAIKQAEALSPVWQAVKNNITIETTFELLQL